MMINLAYEAGTAKVLRASLEFDVEGGRPYGVVLAAWRNEFVTWIVTYCPHGDDWTAHAGTYFQSLEAALRDYAVRSQVVIPSQQEELVS